MANSWVKAGIAFWAAWVGAVGRPGELAAATGTETSFQPVKEAELPQGFPGYTPVGTIEIKRYPAYRKATASGVGEFWLLLQHIKRNGIAMTAPVEMDYGAPEADRPKSRSMSFLYGDPALGSTGRQGLVEVADVPEATVISLGCRGARSAATVDAARDRLQQWLRSNEDRYQAAGPLRVLGYNSPMVPKDQQFFEVQIPIRPVRDGGPTAE